MNAHAKYSVFLVDDDKMFLTALRNYLRQKFGSLLRISVYCTGEESIQRIFQFHPFHKPPDIVILDYHLENDYHPDAVDGVGILKKLKSISTDTIVIMLSGQDKPQVINDSLENGAFEFISKTENAFFCIQNTIQNAIENIKSARKKNRYTKWTRYMGIFIISMVLLVIIRYLFN